jgi:prepilin-type N-terminal cleavage/methylation domain-containing protein
MSTVSLHEKLGAAGFTLIELMITAVVLGILAGVSLPSYAEFVRRGTRAETQAFPAEMAPRQRRAEERAAAVPGQPLDLPRQHGAPAPQPSPCSGPDAGVERGNEVPLQRGPGNSTWPHRC